MKKCFYLFAVMLFTALTNVQANPGDTTWVQANNRRFDRGNGYGNYDTAVAFPSGAVTYRKIYMVFTLGKYACPGYDPSNPGEGAGQTGWCGDWDYDVHNIVMTPTDTFELGRLITPYANSNWIRTPLTFTYRYIFDVTDYYPILKNAATMRVLYSGYSTGFTGNIRFAFIEGTPERNVLGLNRIWHGGFDYGRATPISSLLTNLSQTAPAGTASSEMKMIITGHGGNNEPNNCAEFCPNTYALSLNGSQVVSQNFWRADCGANNLYPQSGTWTINRANWCPGALVDEFHHKLNGITAGSNYTLGITFPNYTSTEASYKLDGAVVHYSTYNKTVDAAIEDIISPSDAEYHYRRNPITGKPVIMLRNSGSATLTSVKFEYKVVGRTAQTYTWNGSLAPSATTEVTLAELNDLKLNAGTWNFNVKITEANGAADGYALNNEMTSSFVAAPMWPTDIIVQFKNNAQANQTKWKIEDMNGNVIREKSNCGTSATCTDTVSLAFGKAYKLIVSDTANYGYYSIPNGQAIGSFTGDGLRISSTNTGYVRVRRRDNNSLLPMAAAMISTPFEGMFGFGFTHYFYTGFPNTVGNVNATPEASIQAYPNPATSQINVMIDGLSDASGMIELIDMTGRTVAQKTYGNGVLKMDVSTIAPGIYQVIYKSSKYGDLRLSQRLSITK